MTKGERIRIQRERTGLTSSELAAKIDVSKQNMYKYENDIITNIPSDKIELIAKYLNVSPAYIMGWEDNQNIYSFDNIRPIKRKKFPLLGEIACGKPIYCNEAYETYIEAAEDIQADFCLIAKGDSMINARIFDGDIIFIKEQPIVQNGEIAAVVIEDEATLKKIYIKTDKIILRPENPVYDDIIYEKEDMNMVKILGKAVAFQSLVR